MNKFFAALLAVVLVFSLCVTATAAPATLTNHSYKAYQIFSGTESSVGLTKIDWGTGVDGDDLLAALQADDTLGSTFASCETAADVAEVMAAWTNDSAQARAFAKLAFANKAGSGSTVVSGSTTLDAGYYLIVDTTSVSGQDDVANLALLKQTASGKVEFASKVDKPVLQKKVKDANDSDTADATSNVWQDSADYDFGDTVPFQLTATLGTIADYDTYKVVFHDTQDAGFGIPANFVVKIDGTDKTSGFSVSQTGNDFTVTCADVKALGATDGSVITVEYTAELLNTATVGAAGNWNEAYLEYSNDANHSGSGDTGNTGDTPKDKVVVFTYAVKIDKYNERAQKLDGAKFTVSKWDTSLNEGEGGWKELGEFDANSAEDYLKGIDAGKYKIEESGVPEGYTKMEDQEIVISAIHTLEADVPALEKLTVTGFDEDVVALKGSDAETGFAATGEIALDITNIKGSQLPETGGIGTTIFYAVGGILVVAALVLLITKKRMGAEN